MKSEKVSLWDVFDRTGLRILKLKKLIEDEAESHSEQTEDASFQEWKNDGERIKYSLQKLKRREDELLKSAGKFKMFLSEIEEISGNNFHVLAEMKNKCERKLSAAMKHLYKISSEILKHEIDLVEFARETCMQTKLKKIPSCEGSSHLKELLDEGLPRLQISDSFQENIKKLSKNIEKFKDERNNKIDRRNIKMKMKKEVENQRIFLENSLAIDQIENSDEFQLFDKLKSQIVSLAIESSSMENLFREKQSFISYLKEPRRVTEDIDRLSTQTENVSSKLNIANETCVDFGGRISNLYNKFDLLIQFASHNSQTLSDFENMKIINKLKNFLSKQEFDLASINSRKSEIESFYDVS